MHNIFIILVSLVTTHFMYRKQFSKKILVYLHVKMAEMAYFNFKRIPFTLKLVNWLKFAKVNKPPMQNLVVR